MTIVRETARLQLREFTVAEAAELYRLNADLDALRFTGDAPFRDVAEARAFLAGYDVYHRTGYGRWSVYRTGDGAYLGWCGLALQAGRDDVDIGFRLPRERWNRGYATEAARGALELGFGHYGLPKIVGRAMRGNVASRRVLEKLGMTPARVLLADGSEWIEHELTAERFGAGAAR